MQSTDLVTVIPGVGQSFATKLQRLDITTVGDLLYHFPFRYEDFRQQVPIGRLQVDETVTIKGSVWQIENTYTKRGKRITTAILNDGSGSVQLIWFNQTYLTKVIQEGDTLIAAGKVSWWTRKRAIVAPFWQKLTADDDPALAAILPIYPETEGITSAWLRKTIKKTWELFQSNLIESLPQQVLTTYHLPPLYDTIQSLHFPTDFDQIKQARHRLAFEEMLDVQTKALQRRQAWQQQQAPFTFEKKQQEPINQFIKTLPFILTNAQKNAAQAILEDLQNTWPMNRLLQGDVGSGKTVVAAIAAYASKLSGYPTFFMAPTEVLVEQHVTTLRTFLQPYGFTIATISGSSKPETFDGVDLFIGTHALFYHTDKLPQAGIVIIDEQHRFGVEQRGKLVHSQDKITPHVLTMTATPIPRSLALTVYGDQDLSLINELPPGRLPVKTWLVPEYKRTKAYQWINEQIASGSPRPQVLVIYPLIEDSDHESMADVKAATTEFEQIKKAFPTCSVSLVHGQLSSSEKNTVVQQFREGNIDILVATSVVEVGIDAPNASIILIENAERFGLATLHQLRGRVGRRGQQ
jgi:ATP-dependent DNA helicase RecG